MGKAASEGRVKLQSLELGRFIAAAVVMMCHAVPYMNSHAVPGTAPLFGNIQFPGPLGVQYFFVLSGFVMASTHHGDFGKLASAPKFWWRRACRIYPVYWLALCIPAYYLYGAMTPGVTFHLMALDPWHYKEYIPTAWTLRYEMAFYLMFGLCLLPYIGRPLLVLWVGLTAWHCFLPTSPLVHPAFAMPFYWYLHGRQPLFVSFMEGYFFSGLAAGYCFAKFRFSRTAYGLILVAGLLLFLNHLPAEQWGLIYDLSPAYATLMAILLAAALLGLAGLERAGAFTLGRWAGWLGAISYPLYIFHAPVFLIVSNNLHLGLHHAPGLYLRLAALISAIFLIAALVTFLFDQPVQRGLRRLTRTVWRPPATAPRQTG